MARVLKIYMRGKSVRTLQNMLKQMGYPMEDQPAIFGVSTRDGVKDFQKRKNLKPTGMVDDELFKQIQQSVGFQTEKIAKSENPAQPARSNETNRLDSLISLLIRKGVISEEELAEAMDVAPAESVADVPLKKPSHLPMG